MRPSGIVLWTVRPTCAKLRFFAWPGESSGVYAPVSPCCSLVQREWRSWNVHKNKTKSCVAQCVYLFVAAFDTIVLCSLSCLVRVIQLVACACACAWLAHTLAHSHTHTLAHSHTRTLANSHTCTLAHSHTRTLAHTHTRTPVLSFFARQTHTHTAYIEPHAAVHTP